LLLRKMKKVQPAVAEQSRAHASSVATPREYAILWSEFRLRLLPTLLYPFTPPGQLSGIEVVTLVSVEAVV
jgi:hypothetical protein